jgi:hypothetical protein
LEKCRKRWKRNDTKDFDVKKIFISGRVPVGETTYLTWKKLKDTHPLFFSRN